MFARIHLAGVIGNVEGRLSGAEDAYAALDHRLTGRVNSQLPPRSAATSTITEPGAIRAHHLAGNQNRSLLARNRGGGDHDVVLGQERASSSRWRA